MTHSYTPRTLHRASFPTAEDMMPSAAFTGSRNELGVYTHEIIDNSSSEDNLPVPSSAQMHTTHTSLQHNHSNSQLYNQNTIGFQPPSSSERWRNYLEATRGGLVSFIATDDISENSDDETATNISGSSSGTRVRRGAVSTENDRLDQTQATSPIPTHHTRLPIEVPRLLAENLRGLGDRRYDRSNERAMNFEILRHDGSHISVKHRIQNILKNDETVYCSLRGGVVNIQLKYAGYAETGYTSDTICCLSKIYLKSPLRGFSSPCSGGLIFVSHKEIDVRMTNHFDTCTKESYDTYVKAKGGNLHDEDPVGFFTLNCSNSNQDVIRLSDKPAKYVLIKLLTACRLRPTLTESNIDFQFVGFIGRAGPRTFASANIC